MSDIVLGLVPVFLLIVAGHGFKRSGWMPDAFWPAAERLTYFVFFPALLVSNTAKAQLAGIAVAPLAAALIGPILAVSAAAVAVRPWLAGDGPSFTSLFQGQIRPNTYIGIAGAAALFGDRGLTLTAVAIVCCIPTVNLLSVAALARFAAPTGTAAGWRTLPGSIVRNPLIAAPLLGLALNAAGIGSPPIIGPFLEVLGRAALPVGLMAVGAGLDPAAVRTAGRLVAKAAAVKLLVLPALTFGMARLVGLDSLSVSVCVLYASLPCSASSYVLARQMGGDARLMAGIITATTIVAAVTIPLAMTLLG